MPIRGFPNWEELYRGEAAERMPWYYPRLDPDLKRALDERGIASGRALDLGTGPGTQALALAERGLDVTASDLSATAVEKARAIAEAKGSQVRFVQDDVLDSHLEGGYDVVFDRGCFHVLAPELRERYARTVAGLIKPAGLLFLKCFSEEQPGTQGPYRIPPHEIEATFAPAFEVLGIERTVYQGTLDPWPKALFCTLRRRG